MAKCLSELKSIPFNNLSDQNLKGSIAVIYEAAQETSKRTPENCKEYILKNDISIRMAWSEYLSLKLAILKIIFSVRNKSRNQ